MTQDHAGKGGIWQPIRTCPKDGSRFLAYATCVADEFDEEGMIRKGAVERYSVVAYWLFGAVVSFPFSGGIPLNVQYTDWMPLPLPPPERE